MEVDVFPASVQMVVIFLFQSVNMVNYLDFCISGINPTWVVLLHLFCWAISHHLFAEDFNIMSS